MTPAYIFLGADEASLSELSSKLLLGSDAKTFTLIADPREALETMPETLRAQNLELARIIAVVTVSVLERRGELRPWFDLLAHFADVMLLTQTKEVSPAWLVALKKSLKDRPLAIYDWPIKKDATSVIEAILTPETRRLTQYFDEPATDGVPIFTGDDEEEATVVDISGDDGSRKDDDEIVDDDPLPVETYFARDAVGRYRIKVQAP